MRPALTLALLSLSVAACTIPADKPAPYDASPLGAGLRLAQVQDPKSPDYHPSDNASMSSLVVTWLDSFDETMDGKSKGTLYVQDVGSTSPYAGIGIFQQSLVPASLTVLPGDVLDFQGPYQESVGIGSAVFNTGTFLPQLYKPVGTFRYEFTPPSPVVITVDDLLENGTKLDASFASSRKWLGMLVTLKDVTVAGGTVSSNRVQYLLEEPDGGVAPAGPSITNEHYDLKSTEFKSGTHFSSVTGIVTWFYSFHVAPRYPADLVQ